MPLPFLWDFKKYGKKKEAEIFEIFLREGEDEVGWGGVSSVGNKEEFLLKILNWVNWISLYKTELKLAKLQHIKLKENSHTDLREGVFTESVRLHILHILRI